MLNKHNSVTIIGVGAFSDFFGDNLIVKGGLSFLFLLICHPLKKISITVDLGYTIKML